MATKKSTRRPAWKGRALPPANEPRTIFDDINRVRVFLGYLALDHSRNKRLSESIQYTQELLIAIYERIDSARIHYPEPEAANG